MFYGIFFVGIIALIALYKFLPNKKYFHYLCIVLLTVFFTSAFIQNHYRNETMSRAQLESLQLRQKIFGEWYADYQKDINSLDRNWQRFYNIVETLKTAEVYEYSTYEQLLELEQETLDEQKRINELVVPPELHEECRDLLASVIVKTKTYADAQVKTISLTRQAADPATVTDVNRMNRRINEITIRETPAGLFTATEISAIRDILGDKD